MDEYPDNCLIWPKYRAKVTWLKGVTGRPTNVSQVDSPRAGGKYQIAGEDERLLSELSEPQRARLTTRLIDHQRQTGRPLLIRKKEVEETRAASDLKVTDRAQRLMSAIGRWPLPIGQEITLFSQLGPGASPTMWYTGEEALALSESTTADELIYLCKYLANKGWIEVTRPTTDLGVVVTVDGHAALELPPYPESNKVFVAMWLDDSMDKVYEQGIKPGIEAAGYEAFRIDRDRTVDKIDDAIMAGIRGCRFLVADFTHGDDGVRGSVYFEAGFARGLGIEVVSTCRKDCVKRLHFDTRQYYHIAWEKNKLDKLHNEIADRIHARIGPGSAFPRTQPFP